MVLSIKGSDPLPCEQTDYSENITLPQTLFAGSKYDANIDVKCERTLNESSHSLSPTVIE